MSLRSAAFSLARVSGLPAAMRRVNRYNVPVLMYHGFTRREHSGDHFESLHIDEIAFRQHLEFLSDNYTVISLRELAAAISGGDYRRPRTAVITIDDGYAGVAEIAFPLLVEFGLPATVFLCTDFLGGSPLYNDRVEYAVKNCVHDRIAVRWLPEGAALSLSGDEARWACYSSLMEHLKNAAHADRDSLIDALEIAAGTVRAHR